MPSLEALIETRPRGGSIPLVALAIPSVILGYILFEPMLFGEPSLLSNSITVLPQNDVLATLAEENIGPLGMAVHSIFGLTFWLVISGIFVAWVSYIMLPGIPSGVTNRKCFCPAGSTLHISI